MRTIAGVAIAVALALPCLAQAQSSRPQFAQGRVNNLGDGGTGGMHSTGGLEPQPRAVQQKMHRSHKAKRAKKHAAPAAKG